MTVPVKPLSKLFNRVFSGRAAHQDEEMLYLIDMVGSNYQDKWMAKIHTDDDMWDAIQKYLQRGADINARGDLGQTALSKLVEKNEYPACAARMIAEGADPNIQDTYLGFSPLMYAAMKGNADMMKTLIDGGADVNAATTDSKSRNVMSFLIYNVEYECRNSPQTGRDCLKMLLDHGATLGDGDRKYIFENAKSLTSMLPGMEEAKALDEAVAKNDPEAVKSLLAKGTPADAAAAFGVNAALLRAIAEKKDPAIMEALLGAGADHERRSPESGYTPLQQAAFSCNREAFQRLLCTGADISAPFEGKPSSLVKIAALGTDAEMPAFVQQALAEYTSHGYQTELDHKVEVHHSLHPAKKRASLSL